MKATITLIRVDNRLVHGQVGTSWANSLDIDTIVVVDDEVVHNPFPQKLMLTIAKTANVQIRFYDMKNFIQAFLYNNSQQKLFVVVKTIHVVRTLCDLGLPPQRINIGNIHYEKGRVPFNRKMYLNEQDVEDLNYLNQKGYSIFYQDVPGTISEKIELLSFDKFKKR